MLTSLPPPLPGCLRLALALDASGALTSEHFGDAVSFRVVDLCGPEDLGVTVVELPRVAGDHDHLADHHHGHGSSGKADGVMGRMRAGGVQVLVGRAFGGNIQRVKARFVPVVVRPTAPAAAIAAVAAHFDEVMAAWRAGAERGHLVLRP